MGPRPTLRKTRFVCISDTHNTFHKLPRGDVLIHAGDLTNQGSLSELRKTIQWIEKADFETKIVIAGNHDITLDESFYEQYGSYFHNTEIQDPSKCLELIKSRSTITYLNHEAKTISLTSPDGPQATFKVFGSPYSPSRGLWAFGYATEDADTLWGEIPLDTDVVISHTPPKFHCDESPSRGAAGCESLRQALWRVRPRMAVCGHVHEGRGVESVLWDLLSPNVKCKEQETFYWHDWTLGSNKQYRVDLTSRSQRPLRNDGATPHSRHSSELRSARTPFVPTGVDGTTESINSVPLVPSSEAAAQLPPPIQFGEHPFRNHEMAQRPIPQIAFPETNLTALRGQGGPFTSGCCDFDAINGREGREETCIVNAAIVGSSWPHKAGKRFNKPIVVDVDLPVARQEGE